MWVRTYVRMFVDFDLTGTRFRRNKIELLPFLIESLSLVRSIMSRIPTPTYSCVYVWKPHTVVLIWYVRSMYTCTYKQTTASTTCLLTQKLRCALWCLFSLEMGRQTDRQTDRFSEQTNKSSSDQGKRNQYYCCCCCCCCYRTKLFNLSFVPSWFGGCENRVDDLATTKYYNIPMYVRTSTYWSDPSVLIL